MHMYASVHAYDMWRPEVNIRCLYLSCFSLVFFLREGVYYSAQSSLFMLNWLDGRTKETSYLCSPVLDFKWIWLLNPALFHDAVKNLNSGSQYPLGNLPNLCTQRTLLYLSHQSHFLLTPTTF